MAQRATKVGSFSMTTSGTVAVSPQIHSHGRYRANYWIEITAVTGGSAWATGTAFKWVSPGGNALVLGTLGAITSTTNSALISWTTALAAATAMANPEITHVQATVQTAGGTTSGISGDIYLIEG